MKNKSLTPTAIVLDDKTLELSIRVTLDDILERSAKPTRGRPKSLTPEQERILVALVNAGIQGEDIAEVFGISRSAYFKYRQRLLQEGEAGE